MQIELCNDCGGLVGWKNLRKDCCPGGVVCRSVRGTHFRQILWVSTLTSKPEPYDGTREVKIPTGAGLIGPSDEHLY